MGKINDEPLLTPEIIRAYYESATVDLSVLSKVNFRHFRFRLADGFFYKIPRKIRVWKDLKKQLLDELPLDVYYSSACWLNPHKLGGRTEQKILENIMISCDLVFDIDVNGETIKNLEQARKQTISLKNFLVSKNITVRYLAFSGSKGFHVVCNDPWNEQMGFEDPIEREKSAIEKRKQIVKEAKAQGLVFDEKVTIDTRRIIRLPGTINSKTGLICTVLSESQIELGIEKIFKLVVGSTTITPRIPFSIGEMTKDFVPAKSLRAKGGRLGVRPTLKNDQYFSTFMTNNIPKTQLKIPILEFGKWKSIGQVYRIIVRVQKKYGIGDVFLFEDEDKYIALSLKAISRRRLEKILFNADSLNLNACKKYGCTYLRVGSSIGLDGSVVHPAPLFLKILESDLSGQVSRPHLEFLVSMGVKVRSTEHQLCGPDKDTLEIIHGVME